MGDSLRAFSMDMGMVEKNDTEYGKKETERRRDATLLRLLKTPPKPRKAKDSKKMGGAAKKQDRPHANEPSN